MQLYDGIAGEEIFVGLSHRTNIQGIESLREVYGRNYPIHVINLQSLQIESVLHLKSICSMAGPNLMLTGGEYASRLQREMQKYSSTMKFIELVDEGMANCLYINGTIVRRCDWEFPTSLVSWEKSLSLRSSPQLQVPNSELMKVDGALTCCSVLLT
jgi:dimethylargininase